jgi:hypothetical protein
MTRLAQTLALLVAAPFLWAAGVITYSLVMIGSTAQVVRKIWR